MAATNAAMRQMFTRLGFTQAAAQAVVIVDYQGFNSLAKVKLLKDEEVESLCTVIRRPVDSTVPAADPAADPAVPNPGIQVSLKAKNQMKLLVFYLRHQERVRVYAK